MTPSGKTGQPAPGAAPLVDAFFDLRSPYSYLALTPFRLAMRDARAEVRWHPFAIDIAATYGAPGSRDAREECKTKYLYMDVRRIAVVHGLTIRGPLRIYDAALAHLGMIHARAGGFLDAYMDMLYSRFFSRAIDIEQRDEVAAVIEAAGGSVSGFIHFVEGEGPAALLAETRLAEDLGIFGVPAFIHEGELFWGLDRIPMLAARIGATA